MGLNWSRPLRTDALACFEAALAAVEPERLVRAYLGRHSEALMQGVSAVHVAAAGKAAAAMTRGAIAAVGDRIEGGVVVAPADHPAADRAMLCGLSSPWRAYFGAHPLPDENGAAGAAALRDLATGLDERHLLLCLLSGGGSSLTSLPADGLDLEDLRTTTEALLLAGATIDELNAVRKHLETLKGGRLAACAAPARVLALVLSDVVGDRLDVIASGPLSPDPTTFADALAILERRDAVVPPAVRRRLENGAAGRLAETPAPGDPVFERVTVRIVGNNLLAAEAALEEAERRGYRALLLTRFLTGEAREVGATLASLARQVHENGAPVARPACLIAAGETRVTVRGRGRGGRNQEVALGAALALAESELEGDAEVMVAALGTDGIDGPTGAAGALGSGDTVRRASALGLDPHRALSENDSHSFFGALGDLVTLGPTGTNVMDLMLVLVR